jgi:hypothetical protein
MIPKDGFKEVKITFKKEKLILPQTYWPASGRYR